MGHSHRVDNDPGLSRTTPVVLIITIRPSILSDFNKYRFSNVCHVQRPWSNHYPSDLRCWPGSRKVRRPSPPLWNPSSSFLSSSLMPLLECGRWVMRSGDWALSREIHPMRWWQKSIRFRLQLCFLPTHGCTSVTLSLPQLRSSK